jgi:Tol biopolymer transport system component
MSYKTNATLTTLIALVLATNPAQALVTSVTTSTSTIWQLTDYVSPSALLRDSVDPTISKDGSTIVFTSNADLIPGLNPNHFNNIYIMNSDGTALRQLTSAAIPITPVELTSYYDTSTPPRLSANGKVVVFASYLDLTGDNPPEFSSDVGFYQLNYQIFIINSDGSGLRQLTRGTGGHSLKPRISDDGRTIAFESSQDLLGSNADHTREIFVINADGTGLAQITNGVPYPKGRNIRGDESRNVAISGDGTTIAFDSFNDLLPPKNDDWSNEIFVFDLVGYRRSGATFIDIRSYTTQITDTDVDAPFHIRAEDSFEPSLSYDGSVVAFSACINPGGEGIKKPDRTVLGDNPFLPDVIFIAKRDGSGLRQLTFSDDPNAYAPDSGWKNIDDDAHWPEISADGTKIVFGTRSRADLAPGSGLYEIAMIDLNAPLDHDGRPVVEQLTKQARPAVTQLSFGGTDGARLHPSIDADASLITLRTSSNLTGGNTDGNSEIFLIKPIIEPVVVAPSVSTSAPEKTSGAEISKTESTTEGGGGALGVIDVLLGITMLGSLVRRRRAVDEPAQALKR